MSETSTHGKFISSEDVEGTDVFSTSSREKIGVIHHLVIDKVSGQVAYADMSFGGFLGIGEDHYPIPWKALSYDTSLDGFVTGITEDQLKAAPPRQSRYPEDRGWEERLHRHYGLPGYWGAGL